MGLFLIYVDVFFRWKSIALFVVRERSLSALLVDTSSVGIASKEQMLLQMIKEWFNVHPVDSNSTTVDPFH